MKPIGMMSTLLSLQKVLRSFCSLPEPQYIATFDFKVLSYPPAIEEPVNDKTAAAVAKYLMENIIIL